MTWKCLDFLALGFSKALLKYFHRPTSLGNDVANQAIHASVFFVLLRVNHFLFLFSVSVDSCSGSPEVLHSYFHIFLVLDVSQLPPPDNAIVALCVVAVVHPSAMVLSVTHSLLKGFSCDSVLPSTMCLHCHYSSLGIDPSAISPFRVFMAPWGSCHGLCIHALLVEPVEPHFRSESPCVSELLVRAAFDSLQKSRPENQRGEPQGYPDMLRSLTEY